MRELAVIKVGRVPAQAKAGDDNGHHAAGVHLFGQEVGEVAQEETGEDFAFNVGPETVEADVEPR